MRARALAGAVVFVAACDEGFYIDPDFCNRWPTDPACPAAGAGGAGGAAGLGGGPSGTSGAGGMGGASGLGGGGTGGVGGSGGLACGALAVDCDGTCVEVKANDVEHCGACDYACGTGSTCTDGVCSAVAVVSGVVAPYAFALDAQNLYFVVPVKGPGDALPSAVQKVARAGGPATSVFTTTVLRSRSLALTDNTLFFGDLDNAGQLLKGATTGGLPQLHLANQPAIQQLVAADGRLWWSTFDGNSRLRRVSATGTPTMAEELTFQNGRVDALAVEGAGATAAVYWVNRDTSPSNNSGLWHKAGAAAAQRLVEGPGLRTLALGQDGVYVTDGATVSRVAKATAGALTLVVLAEAAGGVVHGLAVAGERLYWLAFNAGQLELHRSGLDGSEARVLGRVAAKSAAYWGSPIGPAQLTVDGGFVYFSDPGTVTGNTSASNPGLEGVTGAADGAIYRLPQ